MRTRRITTAPPRWIAKTYQRRRQTRDLERHQHLLLAFCIVDKPMPKGSKFASDDKKTNAARPNKL
jgi:hypothetical protein